MSEKAVTPNYLGEVSTPKYSSSTNEMVESLGESLEPKKVVLEGVEVYADVITQYKQQMVELLKQNIITEQTVSQLVLESELSFFKQIVKVKYS